MPRGSICKVRNWPATIERDSFAVRGLKQKRLRVMGYYLDADLGCLE
jgi:hypothetical protein